MQRSISAAYSSNSREGACRPTQPRRMHEPCRLVTMKHPHTRSTYNYICLFLLQLFMLVACGSYVNTSIVCMAYSGLAASQQAQCCHLCAVRVFNRAAHICTEPQLATGAAREIAMAEGLRNHGHHESRECVQTQQRLPVVRR